MTEFAACEELQNRVIKQNLCTYCGACLGMCPYLLPYKGKVIERDKCTLSRGRCHAFCPRMSVDLEALHQSIFGSSYEWNEIGQVKDIFMARALDRKIRSASQYGGVVTALSCMLIEMGAVDSVVLTNSRDKLLPRGHIAATRKEVVDCAGSSYVASPTIEAFNRAVRDNEVNKIAVIGTPCQLLALANMQVSDTAEQKHMDKLRLMIGLFCTWALSHEGFVSYLRDRAWTDEIVRMDIPPPPAETFEIHKRSEQISLPLSEVRRFIREACTHCIDMTAEFADLSVGAAEGTEGWNTVLVRSEKASELIHEALKKGIIEVRRMPRKNLNHLKKAALAKKKKALESIGQKTGTPNDLLYLNSCPKGFRK